MKLTTTARITGRDAERVQNEALPFAFMRTREYQWLQYRNGTLDRDTFESYMQPVAFWLSTEVGTAVWTNSQRSFEPEFAGYVNSLLERRDP
jgi:hypothetical protein